MAMLSTNIDKKSFETEFSIVICHATGDKLQSKILFLSIFDPHLSIVKIVFDCRLPSVWNFVRKKPSVKTLMILLHTLIVFYTT